MYRRQAKLVSADWRESGDAIQELLRLRLHVQTGILMRLIARDGGDTLHEIEDALCRPLNYAEHRGQSVGESASPVGKTRHNFEARSAAEITAMTRTREPGLALPEACQTAP